MATSIASQSTALTWGTVVLAVILFVAGLAWGKIVTVLAEREARNAASEIAKEIASADAKIIAEAYIREWVAENGSRIIREQVELIANTSLGEDDDKKAADEIGKNA